MNSRLRTALIAAVISLIATPIIAPLLINGIGFSVIVMLEIAVVGFFTVIFVMIVGSEEDHYPTDAKDSAAVAAWSERADRSQQVESDA